MGDRLRKWLPDRRGLIIIVAVAVALAAGGTALAATTSIPDANGVIHSCYLPSTGTIRVIDTGKGQICKPAETSLTWNQQGPQGPQGPPGPAGPTGATGPQGPAGPAGPAGTGATVRPLSSGDPNCSNGGASVTGGNGTTGYACNGATGPQGPAGANGTNGVSGYQIVNDGNQTLNELTGADFYVDCPAGKVAVGGGVISGGDMTIDASAPSSANDPANHPNGWYMHLFDNSALTPVFLTVYAICVNAS